MPYPLKYQSLIDSFSLSLPCPNNCGQVKITAYRWVKSSFADGQSFLPNHIFDTNRGKKPRKNDRGDEVKCGMCALSFFDSIDSSSKNVEAIGGSSKLLNLLGYSHLATGEIEDKDGLASDIDDVGHFIFFEFEGIELEKKFSIIQPI
jgi:hypothetical protein